MTLKHITKATKHGTDDARTFAEENPGEVEAALQPGQLGADEALVNALGVTATAKIFGVRHGSAQWSQALSAYSRAHLTELARIHAASAFGRLGGSATSKAKAKAVRANGMKGGRPVGAKDSKPRKRAVE